MMKWVGSLTALFTLTLVACGGGGGSSPASTPTQPTTSPAPAPLSIISVGCGRVHPGEYAGLACIAEISDTDAQAHSLDVRADMSIFGRSANAGFTQCPACGGPPWTYDLDVRIPADMTPGVKTFAVWATDSDGHRTDTTASMEVVGPPSQLSISTHCYGPIHLGQALPTTCSVFVEDVNYPQEQRFDVWADLRIFGQPAEVQAVPACSGCSGGPPWGYVIELHIPANITPGVKTFAVWAGTIYAGPNEHRADTTASIEILAQ
jgi:hypothetical protein